MDIVLLFNGLGNQMSQYAFYLSKMQRTGKCKAFFVPASRHHHNGFELKELFNIEYPNKADQCLIYFFYRFHKTTFFKWVFKNVNCHTYKEPVNYDYSDTFLNKGESDINFYFGGWHSEKYFKGLKDEIRITFSFNIENEIDEKFLSMKDHIKGKEESVSIHIRRGDYLNQPSDSLYQFDGIATIDYYNHSIKYIQSKIKNYHLFVFSDDIEWCKTQFDINDITYVDCNKGQKSWRDMYLMTLCKHHICANSTFSWWGAWLAKCENGITIHPKGFIKELETKDIYPSNWIELS